MKRIVHILLICLLLMSITIINPAFITTAYASENKVSIQAKSAILMKSDGTILYTKNANARIVPASTAKLLSAIVAIQWCRTDEVVTVGAEVNRIAKDASRAGLKIGERITVRMLLSAMLLPSGNDAAYVMASYVGKKSLKNPKAETEAALKEFIRLMNVKARLLGAKKSCFLSPDGYDAIGQYTTAYDMGRIGLAALKSSTILNTVRQRIMTVKLISGQQLTWNNTNELINKKSIWYNPYVIGLKTGSTQKAGRCLISAARNGNKTVLSVVMNSTSQGRWKDSNQLLKYGLQK